MIGSLLSEQDCRALQETCGDVELDSRPNSDRGASARAYDISSHCRKIASACKEMTFMLRRPLIAKIQGC